MDQNISFLVLLIVLIISLCGIYFFQHIQVKHRSDFAFKSLIIGIALHVLLIVFSRYLFLEDFLAKQTLLVCFLYLPFCWYAFHLSLGKPFHRLYLFLNFVPGILLWTTYFILLSNSNWFDAYYNYFRFVIYLVFSTYLLFYSAYGLYVCLSRKKVGMSALLQRVIGLISLSLFILTVLYYGYAYSIFYNTTLVGSDVTLHAHLLLLFCVVLIVHQWYVRFNGAQQLVQNPDVTVMQSQSLVGPDLNKPEIQQAIGDLEALELDYFLDSELNLEKLSRQLRVSKNELSFIFSVGLHTSFTKYVNQKRCSYASELLIRRKQSEDSVEDIGFKSGFNSTATFYRAFKDNYGTSPSKFT